MEEKSITSIVVTVVISLVIVGVVMIPIINNATSHMEIVDIPDTYNENPIGDLRLAYSTDTDWNNWFNIAYYGGGTGITGGTLPTSENPEGTTDYDIWDLTDDQILFASDNVSAVIRNGMFHLSINGIYHVPIQPVLIEITDVIKVYESERLVLESPYTFIYYPSDDGTYANYTSYMNDNGMMYANGTFANLTLSSREGEMVGSNTYGFGAIIKTEDDSTVGVHYEVTV